MGDPEGGRPEEATGAGPWPLEPTGVPGLDEVLGGGLPSGSLALVVGPPGAGKTTLATQMAFAAAGAGRPALILTALSEPADKLLAHLRTYRFFDALLVGGAIQIFSLRQYLDRGLATAAGMITADARRLGARLVVLDGFSGVRGAAADPQASREFLYDLGALGVAALVTSEGTPRDPAHFPELTTVDVVVGLRYALAGARRRCPDCTAWSSGPGASGCTRAWRPAWPGTPGRRAMAGNGPAPRPGCRRDGRPSTSPRSTRCWGAG